MAFIKDTVRLGYVGIINNNGFVKNTNGQIVGKLNVITILNIQRVRKHPVVYCILLNNFARCKNAFTSIQRLSETMYPKYKCGIILVIYQLI